MRSPSSFTAARGRRRTTSSTPVICASRWATRGSRRGTSSTAASPLAQLPLGSPAILVHGTADEVVPFDQSKRYAEAAGAELVPLEGAGHFEPIDPQSREWTAVRDAIRTLAAVRPSQWVNPRE